MRTPHGLRLTARSAGIAMTGLLVAGLAAIAGPQLASASTGHGMTMSGMVSAQRPGTIGDTAGWLGGHDVTLHYTKNYFCQEPPSSGAVSHCELGANYMSAPSSDFDPLYVVVPIGFTPANPGTLQCPTAGNCVDHPRTIDLSRVFGSGTEDALLPPHSHIVTTAAGHAAEWWDVQVVGVTSQGAWHKIVVGKSYRTIQGMRANGNPNVTPDVPTNLFLYFAVQ